MPFRMTEMVGCEFPLFAFSHCRDVVVAASRAGGFGVVGAVSYTPEQLEQELQWIDDHVDGKPYGVDVLIPEVQAVDPKSDSKPGASGGRSHHAAWHAHRGHNANRSSTRAGSS